MENVNPELVNQQAGQVGTNPGVTKDDSLTNRRDFLSRLAGILASGTIIGTNVACDPDEPTPNPEQPSKLVEGEVKASNEVVDLSKFPLSDKIAGEWKSVSFNVDRLVIGGRVQPVINSIDFVGDTSSFDKPLSQLGATGWEHSIRQMLTYIGSNLGLDSSELSKLTVNKFDAIYAEPWKLSVGRGSVTNVKVDFFNSGRVHNLTIDQKTDDGKISTLHESLKSVGSSFYNNEDIMKSFFLKYTLPNGKIVYSPKPGTGLNFSVGLAGRSFAGEGFSTTLIGTINDIYKI